MKKKKENMQSTKNITELVFILDRSGSMRGLESDTIGGFNSLIEKQKQEEGECLVSTILFDGVSEVLHDRIRLSKVPAMTSKDYCVRGCTALIDAIGSAVYRIGDIHADLRREDVPAHTIFIITTDGLENASRRYSSTEVKRMIERQKEEYGWEFIFIGANIDAVETAKSFGIDEDKAVDYIADSQGTGILYDCMENTIRNVRNNKGIDSASFCRIKEDYAERSPKEPDNKKLSLSRI